MNVMLGRATRETASRENSTDAGIMIFGRGLGEGLEAAFAIAVMLAALWLLASGYV